MQRSGLGLMVRPETSRVSRYPTQAPSSGSTSSPILSFRFYWARSMESILDSPKHLARAR